jgi:hypothetical protein
LALSQSLTLSNRLIANQPEQGLFYLYVHFFACPKKQLAQSKNKSADHSPNEQAGVSGE